MIVMGTCLIVAAAVLWSAGRSDPQPEIQVSPSVVDLGTVTADGRYPIHYVVRNSGRRDVTILGVSSSCTKSGCIVAERHEPVSIAPGETFEIDATFIARGTGPFLCGFGLYSDAPGQTANVLKVAGVNAAPESQTEAIAKSNRGASATGGAVDR
jgi:hypothetical protein